MGYADFPDKFEDVVQKLMRGWNAGRKLQIGIIVSVPLNGNDLELEQLAEQVGEYVARAGAALMFKAENYDPLSEAICRGAKKTGGMTVGVTEGDIDEIYELNNADIIIASSNLQKSTLVLSCDAIIVIGGESDALAEIAIAYQARIPSVVLTDANGLSKRVEEQYCAVRLGTRIEVCKMPEKAVRKAITLASVKWLVGGLEH